MKIYIVTSRCGTEMLEPVAFMTRKEADDYAQSIILDAVFNEYDGDSDNPDWSTLESWATENGYELWENYFWSGWDDATETDVTEVEVNVE